jgi:hypothetical protein
MQFTFTLPISGTDELVLEQSGSGDFEIRD